MPAIAPLAVAPLLAAARVAGPRAALIAVAVAVAVAPLLAAPAGRGAAAPVAPASLEALEARASLEPSGARDEGDEASAFIAGLASKGLHDMVVREASQFLERRASHPRANIVRYRRANALFDLERFDDARKDYERLEQAAGFEHAEEVRFRLGQCELRREAFQAAEEDFAAVVSGKQDYLKVPATFLLGEARFRGGSFRGAATAYAEVLKAAGAEAYAADARHGLVWCAWRLGQGDATVQLAEDFARRHADDPRAGEVSFLAGEAHLDAGRADEAERAYQRVDDERYKDGAMRGLAFVSAARGDHAAAARRFGELLKAYPTSRFAAEAALQRGVHLVRAGEPLEGLRVLERPPAVDDATNRYWRSRALALVGDHEGALREARAGLDTARGGNGAAAPLDESLAAQLRIAAGDALFELGREKEAAEFYESSGSAYALHAAAVAKLNSGELAEAERLAAALLEGAAKERGAPYRVESLVVRGEALFRAERYAEAEAPFRAVLAEGDAAAVLRAKGRVAWCDWYAGRHADAARGFAEVAEATRGEAGGGSEEASYMAARAALESGDERAARAAFKRYLERHPAGANAPDALLRLARLSEGADATALLARLADGFPAAPEAETALVELAETAGSAGAHAESAARWRALIERFPASANVPKAAYGLGWSLHRAGDAPGAADALRAAAADERAAPELRLASLELLVWVERDAGRAAASKAAFDELAAAAKRARLEDDPRLLRAARVAAGALEDAGDPAAAAALWNELAPRVRDAAVRAAVGVERAFAALDGGDLPRARALAEEVEAIALGLAGAQGAGSEQPAFDPKTLGELCFFVGEAFYDAGDDGAAVACYRIAAARGDDEVAERALYKAGFAEMRAGRAAEAFPRFAALATRFPKGVLAGESMFLAGEAAFRAGDLDASVEWLKRHVAEAPKHAARPKALFRLGLVQGSREDWAGCAATLAELAAKHADFPALVEAELWRGRALARLGQRRAARQALDGVTARHKGALAAAARIELGRLAEDENDLDGALSEYLKVAVLYADPDAVAESLLRAGDVLARQGDRERAAAQYRELIERHPSSPFAAEARRRLGGGDSGGAPPADRVEGG